MFRKVMQISDDLMWRYYELLTDKTLDEIARMKASKHPMDAKCALGKTVTADFHSAADAGRAESGIRVDKLLAKIGLADSVTDAVRKL